MLVYCKDPHGVVNVGIQKIHGNGTNMPPCDISFKAYTAAKDFLVHATYREGYLRKKFNKDFPEVAFKYDELKYLPDKTLNLLTDCFETGISHDGTRKQRIEVIQRVIRDATPA